MVSLLYRLHPADAFRGDETRLAFQNRHDHIRIEVGIGTDGYGRRKSWQGRALRY
jgi:hypothetical protein